MSGEERGVRTETKAKDETWSTDSYEISRDPTGCRLFRLRSSFLASRSLPAIALALLLFRTQPMHAFSFEEIEFWVGSGANRAALVIDWVERSPNPPALSWGYRWDGTARGSDMLRAIVTADTRLFAKLGGPPSNPNAVYGIGYDADGDGQFALDDGTTFDDSGTVFTSPADLATSADPDDYYAEGWFTGFWHYGVETPAGTNPYDGSNWSDIPVGMASRTLVDGSWDSWSFSPTFNFAAFAENPQPAAPPFSPGDFNRNGRVDAADYSLWRSTFGSTSQLDADGNADGIVDAADYVVWRDHFTEVSAISAAIGTLAVPEPPTLVAITIALFLIPLLIRKEKF
jgi:dockerin type I repeat protein